MDKRRLDRAARGLFALALALFTGLVFEAGARLTGLDAAALRPLLYYQHAALPAHEPLADPELLYGLKPGSSAAFAGASFHINGLGFRDPPRSPVKAKGAVRVVCLGGSHMFGALVDDGQTFPRYLERTLNRHFQGRFEVWNAAAHAYVVRQEAALARRIEALHTPDLLLVHLNGTGRRAFLEGAPFARYFKADPDLYLENLRWVPFSSSRWGPRLMSVSALYRTVVIYFNYLGPRGQPRPDFTREKSERAWKDYLAASRTLKATLLLGASRGPDPPGAVPEIALYRGPDVPARLPDDHFLIHPPARIYRLQAQITAERLSRLFPRLFKKKSPGSGIIEPLKSLVPEKPLNSFEVEESRQARRAVESAGAGPSAAPSAPPPQVDPDVDWAGRLYDGGRFEEALRLLDGKTSPQARHRRALVFQKLQRHAEARDILKGLAREMPNNAVFMKDLGICQYLSGKEAAGIGSLKKALLLKPDLAEASRSLAAIFAARGDQAEADRLLQRSKKR